MVQKKRDKVRNENARVKKSRETLNAKKKKKKKSDAARYASVQSDAQRATSSNRTQTKTRRVRAIRGARCARGKEAASARVPRPIPSAQERDETKDAKIAMRESERKPCLSELFVLSAKENTQPQTIVASYFFFLWSARHRPAREMSNAARSARVARATRACAQTRANASACAQDFEIERNERARARLETSPD